MYELYAFHRKEMSQFFKRQMYMTLYGFGIGTVCYFIYYFTEVYGFIDGYGNPAGGESLGVQVTVWSTLVHHLILILYTDNWDLCTVGYFISSFNFIFWISFINDSDPLSRNYKAITSFLYRTLMFWNWTLICTVVAIMPIYFYLRYR